MEEKTVDGINRKIKAAVLAALAVAGAVSFMGGYPEYGVECESLQHLGTLLLMVPLMCDCVKNRMPMSAFAGVALFALIHIVGARWCYSDVPYKEWFEGLRPCLPAGFFGGRNHYDRLVHFSFGMLLFPYSLYVSGKWMGRNLFAAILVAWLVVQTCSMVYEIFEWQLTLFMTEGDSTTYNGQQGDIWDAQKDMLLAMMGSTAVAVYYAIAGRKRWRARTPQT